MAPPPYSQNHPSVRLIIRFVQSESKQGALVQRPTNQVEIAAMLQCHRQTAKYILTWMHSAKLLRVFAWDRRSGSYLPRYVAWDDHPDAFRPAARPSAEHSRRQRAGLAGKKTKESYERDKAQRREKRRAAAMSVDV